MLTVANHPLIEHWLCELREESTPPSRFRTLLKSLTIAVFLEASRDARVVERPVRTPLALCAGRTLDGTPILAPVLRAGLGMAEGILDLLPEARTCHIGIYRDHETLQAIHYYPPARPEGEMGKTDAYVLDPMLATGGSAVAALELVQAWGVRSIKLLGIVGAPAGVEQVEAKFPHVPIFLAALDERLNDVGYIVPGLGDAGDRQFSGLEVTGIGVKTS